MHCPACGATLERFDDHGVARERCPRCGRVAYRNSKPCVGLLVVRDGRILLSRRAREPAKGLWDLPGGFLESGEHPEDGARRELREEAAMEARTLRLVGIEMGRYGEDDTLNILYEAVADGEPRAGDDSAQMRWFPLGALPEMAFEHERRAVGRLLP